MRMLLLALVVFFAPFAAFAGPTSSPLLHRLRAKHHSNPEYKACLARAADKADAALNEAFKRLQETIRAAAKDMSQSPDSQLGNLKDAQNRWIAYRDDNCTFEDTLAFGGTALGSNYSACLCALSYQRVNDFARIQTQVLGVP